ncbi:MAG: MoaD/ThiS family protein [Pyrodictiaceae archaeon]
MNKRGRRKIRVKVSFFTILADVVGTEKAEVELQDNSGELSVNEMLEQLAKIYPGLQSIIDEIIVIRGEEILTLNDKVRDGDELLLLPPGSGG